LIIEIPAKIANKIIKQLMQHSKLCSVTILFFTINPEQNAWKDIAKLRMQKIAKCLKSLENCIYFKNKVGKVSVINECEFISFDNSLIY
jgi:hypothetical protein